MNSLGYRHLMPAFALIATLLVPVTLFAQARTDLIAQTFAPEPGGNGLYQGFGLPVLNDHGIVAFNAGLRETSGGFLDNVAIYKATTDVVSTVTRMGDAAPEGNGVLDFLGDPILNSTGQIGFSSTLRGTSGGFSDNLGIYRTDSTGNVTNLMRIGQPAPDANGQFQTFNHLTMNNNGAIAFYGGLTSTSGGFVDRDGVFRAGTSVEQLGRSGMSAPGGGQFDRNIGTPFINDSGDLAFTSGITGAPGNIFGVFVNTAGAIQQVAGRFQQLPGSTDTFGTIENPTLNSFGQVGFVSSVDDSTGAPAGNGVFISQGSTVTEVFREPSFLVSDPIPNQSGQFVFDNGGGVHRASLSELTTLASQGNVTPTGNGTFLQFSHTAINATGVVAFRSVLTGTSGDFLDDVGLFVTDGIETLEVVRERDDVAGIGVVLDSMEIDRRYGINAHGQVGYRGSTVAGYGFLATWTPTLHWRHPGAGSWDDNSRWTLGLQPAEVHDVVIDAPTSVSVAGPVAPTTVRSLAVGGGTGDVTLDLGSTPLTVTHGLQVEANGTLIGTEIVGDVNIAGVLEPIPAAAATIGVDGDVSFPGGQVNIELFSPTEFDTVDVTGIVDLTSGSLSVSAVNGYIPLPSQEFDVLSFSDSVGSIDVINDTAFAGLVFTADVAADGVSISTSALPGDADLDGIVDGRDFLVWNANKFTGGTDWLTGDFNGDGITDGADFIIWNANKFTSLGGTQAVPEPASGAAAIVALAMLAYRRLNQ